MLVELPSQDELKRLPRWAQVAFAARCARRVQPLFVKYWPDAPAGNTEAVDAAIRLAEAAHARAAHATYDPAHPAYVAADVVHAAHDAAVRAATTATTAADRAATAARAARAATDAATAFAGTDAATGHDYELLLLAAERKNWTDDTPVPPEFFGPLWPFGKPEGWPEEETPALEEPPRVTFEFEIPEDATDEQVQELAREALRRANAVLTGQGSQGLKIEDRSLQIWSPCPVEVPAG